MVQKLTKVAKIQAEQARISQLTDPHDQHFKLILSHQVDKKFNFSSLNRRNISSAEKLKILNAFGKFMDDTAHMSITNVERNYKRNTYQNDGTYDPETNAKVQVEHFSLYPDNAPPDIVTDGVRLHCYFRSQGGYYVVTRLDWFHAPI